jgi:hypothetical protein
MFWADATATPAASAAVLSNSLLLIRTILSFVLSMPPNASIPQRVGYDENKMGGIPVPCDTFVWDFELPRAYIKRLWGDHHCMRRIKFAHSSRPGTRLQRFNEFSSELSDGTRVQSGQQL